MRFKFLALGVVAVAGFAVAASKLYVDLPIPTSSEVRVQITAITVRPSGPLITGASNAAAYGRALRLKGTTGTYNFLPGLTAGNQLINGAPGTIAVGDICNGTGFSNPAAAGTLPKPGSPAPSSPSSNSKLTCVR